jgi:hypothetical protein
MADHRDSQDNQAGHPVALGGGQIGVPLSRPASYTGTSPRPSVRRRYYLHYWVGALTVLAALSAIGLSWQGGREQEQTKRTQKTVEDTIAKAFKMMPGDEERLRVKKGYADAAADFVQEHLSWRLLSKKDEKPVRSEPTRVIQQFGALAAELGQESDFREFLSSTRYHWVEPPSGILIAPERSWNSRHRNGYVMAMLNAAQRLVAALAKNDRFEALIGQPRYADLLRMRRGLDAAYVNFEIGSGFKPIPKGDLPDTSARK